MWKHIYTPGEITYTDSMPYRITPLATGEYYHIFNRGVEKRKVFTNRRDYKRFLETINYYLQKSPIVKFSQATDESKNAQLKDRLVEIITYCLMPNHFHLLLKQLQNNGISTFMRKISDSYTKYFNTKNERPGPLFQGQFKAVRIETDDQLLHVSRYIHLNPIIGFLADNLRRYEWSSYPAFIGIANDSVCKKDEILNFFSGPSDYEKFVLDQIDYAKKLNEIKHVTLDPDV